MAFIDFEKTYDRVPKEVMWKVLKKRGWNDVHKIIHYMYTKARTNVNGGFYVERVHL